MCPFSRIEWACSRSCAGAPAPSGVQSSSLATSRRRRPRPTSSSGSWSTPRSTPTPPAGLTPPSPWSPPPLPSSSLYEGEFVEDWITNALVYAAMIDYPKVSNFLTPLPAYPVKQIISITTVSRPDPVSGHPLAGESGGLSRKPLFDLSTNILKEMYMLTWGKIPLIGCRGVSSGEDAYKKIRAGATLVQLYTAFSYGGPALIPQIKAELAECLERDGFKSVQEAVGFVDILFQFLKKKPVSFLPLFHFAVGCWRRMDIIIPLTFLYIQLLWETFMFPQSLGILGGKSGASTYIVGVQDNKALYLDSHEIQLNGVQACPAADMHSLQFVGSNPQLGHQSSDQGHYSIPVSDFL